MNLISICSDSEPFLSIQSNLQVQKFIYMMSSVISSNRALNSDTSHTRRKKKKIHHHGQIQSENLESNSPIQWKSDAQQQIYSSKLLHALQQVRISSPEAELSAPRRVRDAAYRALAATAKGRSRWSRAILTNRLKLKFMKKNNAAKRRRKAVTVIAAGSRSQRKSKVSVLRLKSKCLAAFQRKAKVLSRLVPGCRKQPLPVVLEEATNYIAALQMQVQAMGALAELLM